jgi:ribosomal protein S3
MGQKTNPTIFNLSLKNAEWKSKYIEKNKEESSLFLYQDIEIRNYLDQVFKNFGLLIHNCKIEYGQETTTLLVTFFEKKTETSKFYGEKNKNQELFFKSSKELINHVVNNVVVLNLNLFLRNSAVVLKVQNLNQRFAVRINKSKTNSFEYKVLLRRFRRFLKTALFKELVKVLFISISEKNSAKLLAKTISSYFEKQKKRHGFVLFLLKHVLEELITSKISKVNGVKIVISGRFNGVPRANKKILKIGQVPLQSFDSPINYYEDTSYTSNGTFGVKVWISEKR